jgi:hypothetical protein
VSLVAQQITVSVSITDADGSASVIRARRSASEGVDAAMAAAEALIAVLRPLSDGMIARYSVSYQLREDSTIIPLAALSNPTLALFTFQSTPDPDVYSTMVIPLDETWLETTGPLAGFAVDLTNTEVSSFTDEMTNGGWVDQFAVDIGAVWSAFRTEAE